MKKKISEFYRADLKKAYLEDTLLLSMKFKEARDVVENLVIPFDGIDHIGDSSCILHIKLHMW